MRSANRAGVKGVPRLCPQHLRHGHRVAAVDPERPRQVTGQLDVGVGVGAQQLQHPRTSPRREQVLARLFARAMSPGYSAVQYLEREGT